MEIKVKKLTSKAKLPTRGSASAAGYDLYADIEKEVRIAPHTTEMIGTGLSMEIPEGYFGAIFARSGLASDSDYRGPFMIALHNDGEQERVITPGERIAQLVVIPYLPVEFIEADTLSDTGRGSGGFGSTGK